MRSLLVLVVVMSVLISSCVTQEEKKLKGEFVLKKMEGGIKIFPYIKLKGGKVYFLWLTKTNSYKMSAVPLSKVEVQKRQGKPRMLFFWGSKQSYSETPVNKLLKKNLVKVIIIAPDIS